MKIIIYVFAASFIFMGTALVMTYVRFRHYGVLLMGLIYGIAAVLAVVLMHWWPLVAGFALVWILRLSGLDPGSREDDAPKPK